MKAYAIHTVHYKDPKTEQLKVAHANTVIDNISKDDFEDLLKLGAVRKPTKGEVAGDEDDDGEEKTPEIEAPRVHHKGGGKYQVRKGDTVLADDLADKAAAEAWIANPSSADLLG